MLSPTTEEELSTAVAQASGPLRIQGGGTRGIGGPTPGEVCSVAGITGNTLYEPGALTLVAAAGTPVAEIEAALAAENQRLPFEPMAIILNTALEASQLQDNEGHCRFPLEHRVDYVRVYAM